MPYEITTEQVMKNIRKMPVFRQLIPQEAGIGWPIPLRKENRVYVTFLCFGESPNAERNLTILYPPVATLTLDWSTQVPVEYVSLRYANPWPEGQWDGQIGTFPHAAIAHMTVGEYKTRRGDLLSLYDEMFNKLAENQPFSSEWKARFSNLLRLLMEPALEPYYRILGRKFFERFLEENG